MRTSLGSRSSERWPHRRRTTCPYDSGEIQASSISHCDPLISSILGFVPGNQEESASSSIQCFVVVVVVVAKKSKQLISFHCPKEYAVIPPIPSPDPQEFRNSPEISLTPVQMLAERSLVSTAHELPVDQQQITRDSGKHALTLKAPKGCWTCYHCFPQEIFNHILDDYEIFMDKLPAAPPPPVPKQKKVKNPFVKKRPIQQYGKTLFSSM